MMWVEASALLLSCICILCESSTVGYIRGPCDCSPTSDIQCRRLDKVNQLQLMMDRARQKLSEASYTGAYIKSISIQYSNFQEKSLPPNIFHGTGVRFLEILDSPLPDGIVQPSTGRAFVGTGSSIRRLRISNCNLPIERWIDMSNLANLESLSLPRNNIVEIRNLLFSRPPSNLTSLYLYSNGIISLADKAFSKLANIELINLAENQLQTITRSMFATPAMQLQVIHLEDNNIKYLSQDIFSNMPKLRTINLNNNQLTTLEANTWSFVWSQLSQIYLEGNKWICKCASMGWILKPRMIPEGQILTGRCASPFSIADVALEDLTVIDLNCVDLA